MLRELFEANVFKLLVSEGLITAELISRMRTWKHSGFHVYAGPTITQKEDTVRVGLYIVRAPASASRLQLTDGGLLKYLARGSIANDRCDPLFEPNGQILDPLEWIAKVTLHIPAQGLRLPFTMAAIRMPIAEKQPNARNLPIKHHAASRLK